MVLTLFVNKIIQGDQHKLHRYFEICQYIFFDHTLRMERKQQKKNAINIAQTKQVIKIIIF